MQHYCGQESIFVVFTIDFDGIVLIRYAFALEEDAELYVKEFKEKLKKKNRSNDFKFNIEKVKIMKIMPVC